MCKETMKARHLPIHFLSSRCLRKWS